MTRYRSSLIIGMGLLIASNASAYDWQKDLQHRLACDFTADSTEVIEFVRQYVPNVTREQVFRWEQSGALECMTIDGQKRYFHAAARNLFRINPQCASLWSKSQQGNNFYDVNVVACMRNIPQIMRDAKQNAECLAQARRMRVRYTLTVKADAVPAGEEVRCWLPFPREDVMRQTDVELLATSQRDYQRSGSRSAHSTLYMQQKAVEGRPTVFSETFEYTSRGAKFNLSQVKPYNKRSIIYKEYTREREAHVRFTPELRQLADSLTHGMDSPVEKVQSIFRYIDANFPWASAREYSTIGNIPMYVLQNRHGDCGQVTLLFVTLCRIAGIPAHFQSGFQMHPGAVNLHDWAEVYFEGVGWVPVDQSYGIMRCFDGNEQRMFYVGGIDSWRMIVNSDFGRELFPKKRFPRSETVDFQRGEVEWRGGNLYFDQWSWDIEVEYID